MRVTLAENKPLRIRLSPEQGSLLDRSGVVRAHPDPHQPGWWTVQAHNRVGVAQVGEMEVWIAPKLPVSRLLFLAGYARESRKLGWRDEDTAGLDTAEGLVPVVARFLCNQAELALRQGPLKGYRTVEEPSSILRGRLREADQLRRHHGRAIPMEIRYDDFTIDVPENQILLAAIIRIARVPRVTAKSQHRLAGLRAALAGVTVPEHRAGLPAWHPNRLNLRYHAVLRLAEIIWQATSPEHGPGSVPVTGFLFNLATIFEDFLVAALSDGLQDRHGGTPRQAPCYLDQAKALVLKPDLVWQRNGRPSAVVDAKYKMDAPKADLYQVLAYCIALRLPRGHLVYAQGIAQHHVVQSSGIEIVCHALDLMLPPAQLLAQVGKIADELVATAPAA